jgi:hypothetical protein
VLWHFDRPDRLDHLRRRASEQVEYLTRLRCDCRTADQLVAVDRRLVSARARFRRFSTLARVARRNALSAV